MLVDDRLVSDDAVTELSIPIVDDNDVTVARSSICKCSLSCPSPKSVASPITLPAVVVGLITCAAVNGYSKPSGDIRECEYDGLLTAPFVSMKLYVSLAPVLR